MQSKVIVTPWEGDKQPGEKQLRQMLAEEGLRPYRWSNGPYDVYSAHTHPFNKVIYVVQGSITFGLPEQGKEVELVAGDRMDLLKGVLHNAVVGPQGVVCLEAHL